MVLRAVLEDNQLKAPGGSANQKSSGTRIVAPPAHLSGGYISQTREPQPKSMPRVLVIDDEEFIRDLYRDVFEAKGITVFSAQNGDEALKVFETLKYKPDIVIMDHRMPGKDGIETTKELLRLDPSVPIIFSSADESVREQALEAGAVSFWAKPFPMSMLVNAMIDIVDARRKRTPQHFH